MAVSFRDPNTTVTKTDTAGSYYTVKETGTRAKSEQLYHWFSHQANLTLRLFGEQFSGTLTWAHQGEAKFLCSGSFETRNLRFDQIESFTVTYSDVPIPMSTEYKKGKCVQEFKEEGSNPPSPDRLFFWQQYKLKVSVKTETEEVVEGVITTINPSNLYQPDVIFFDNFPHGIYREKITHYITGYVSTNPLPYVLDLSVKTKEKIPQIALSAGEKTYPVNVDKLIKNIPYFAKKFEEGIPEHCDISSILSPQRLALLFDYLDGNVELNSSNALELYCIAKLMEIDRLKKEAEFEVLKFYSQSCKRQDVEGLKLNPETADLYSKVGFTVVSEFRNTRNPGENFLNLLYWSGRFAKFDEDSHKNLTVFKGLSELTLRFTGYNENLTVKDVMEIIRITEILGAKIEHLVIHDIQASDLTLLQNKLSGRMIFFELYETEESSKRTKP